MMRRYIAIVLATFVATWSLSAQVSKQVEVTKEFAPEISEARKMDIAPNMVDTITLRPEIDYSISPRSFTSALGTHKFNPATVTYWEYQRRYPLYLKAGLGYPLRSEADVYLSTHRADVGYLTGYANHYGQYAELRYNGADGQKYKDNKSLQMTNKFGVMGGKYFGRYTLSGDVFYRMDTYSRYPLHGDFDKRKIDFDDIKLALNFGDSFADYSHLNFKVYASADYYHDKSQTIVEGANYQQIDVRAGGLLAREISKRSALSFGVDYRGYFGLRSLSSYDNSIAQAELMFRYRSGGLLDMKVGAKVAYDYNSADAEKKSRWHAFPYLSVSLNINDKGLFVPYIEVDGEVQNNSYYSLVRRNPYVAILGNSSGLVRADVAVPNTELYNVRFGVSGHSANSKFAYRFYANMSFMRNALYWYNINQIFFGVESAKRNVWSLCGAVDYKPISQLLLTAQVKYAFYQDYAKIDDSSIAGAMPNLEAQLKARYSHKKFTFGATIDFKSRAEWSRVYDASLFGGTATAQLLPDLFVAPAWVGLNLYADWHVSKTCTIYAEGDNLLGDVMPTYRWAYYREMGASFVVGVKIQF